MRPAAERCRPSEPLGGEPEDLDRDLAGERGQSRSREHDLVLAPDGAGRELARRRGRKLPQQAARQCGRTVERGHDRGVVRGGQER